MRAGLGVVIWGLLVSGCASAGALTREEAPDPDGARLLAGPRVGPPQGLVEYCRREPDACPRGPAPAARVEVVLTQSRWRELWDVNQEVNRAVKPSADRVLYGVEEYWTRPSTLAARGDCEDYALEKRARLIALGWPPDALALAVANAPGVGVHAALVAQTDHGDLVLDNLSYAPRPLGELDYRWLSRQAGAALEAWALAGVLSADAVQTGVRTAPSGASNQGPERAFQRLMAERIEIARVERLASLR